MRVGKAPGSPPGPCQAHRSEDCSCLTSIVFDRIELPDNPVEQWNYGQNVARTDLRPGDRVLAMAEYGGYAELAAVDRRQVYPLPEVVSFVDAAAMALAFDTAWMSLRERARLQPGDSVLVLGATSWPAAREVAAAPRRPRSARGKRGGPRRPRGGPPHRGSVRRDR